MVGVLLLCCLLQPAPRESAQELQNRVSRRFQESLTLYASEPARSAQILDELLADPALQTLAQTYDTARLQRDQLIYFRASVRLRLGQAQAVLDEMTEILTQKKHEYARRLASILGALTDPTSDGVLATSLRMSHPTTFGRADWIQPLSYRIQAGSALKLPEGTAQDLATYGEIQTQFRSPPGSEDDDPEYVPPGVGFFDWLQDFTPTFRFWLLLAVALFVTLVPTYFFLGQRQAREANAPPGRLLFCVIVLALVQVLPIVVAIALAWLFPWLADSPRLMLGTLCVLVFNFITNYSSLVTPTWSETGDSLPPLEDPAVLARIREMAHAMGLSPPVARLLRSGSSQQETQGMIAGFIAPTLILYDGILYRLGEEERDAIIAHELAHVANGTFWWWLFANLACSVLVVAVSPFFHPVVLGGMGFALLTGITMALTRGLELDCDRRAARAIGHLRTASALHKLHADQPFRSMPVLEFLIGATNTHPSRDERLAAVHADAPADAKPPVEWEPAAIWRRRLATWLAGALGLGVIVACLFWARAWPYQPWPGVPMILLALAPTGLLWLGLRKSQRRMERLQKRPFDWLGLVPLLFPLLIFLWMLADYFQWIEFLNPNPWKLIVPVALLVLWGVVAWTIPSGRRAQQMNQKIGIAISAGDWEQALEVCEASPEVVATNRDLSYNQGLIKAVLGRRDEGIAELERCRQKYPEYKMTWLALISLYTDEGRFTEGLTLAREVTADLPGDPVGPLLEGWLLRKLGQLDEAEARARVGLDLESDSELGLLTLAAVALDRGDLAGAREGLARVERVSPGSIGAALLTAEIALASDAAQAGAAIERAASLARTTPLAFAEKEVASLFTRLPRVTLVEPEET